jgi:hypothetical protein
MTYLLLGNDIAFYIQWLTITCGLLLVTSSITLVYLCFCKKSKTQVKAKLETMDPSVSERYQFLSKFFDEYRTKHGQFPSLEEANKEWNLRRKGKQ